MRRALALAVLLTLVLAGSAPGARAGNPARQAVTSPLPAAPGCPIFPANNVWNVDVSRLPVAADSAAMIQSIGLNTGLHPDFGSNPAYGIPFNVVSGQAGVGAGFDYAGESDPGPYPIPPNPLIESGSDAHLLIVNKDTCYLYEMWDARQSGGRWLAGSGAVWNLRSNSLRPDTWTSADAAGLPILPGLVRYDEIVAGAIDHALRFTAVHTRNAHIYPARHDAGQNNAAYPPMGLRVRLRASVDTSGFSPQVRVVLQALKTYGMILADNGSNWFVSGASDPRFNDDDLHLLNRITGSDFDVVDTSGLVNGPDQAGTPSPTASPMPPSPTVPRATSTLTSTPLPPTATVTSTPLPPTSTSTLPASRTIVLTPVADAYVRDGSYAGTNFGMAADLVVKYAPGSGYNRQAFLRFDLRGLPGTVTAATLRLYGQHLASKAWHGSESVYSLATDSWIERGAGGITWRNKPVAASPALATTQVGPARQYYGWNLGSYAAARQRGSGLVSLVLCMNASGADGSLDRFNAREAGANPPQLVLTVR
jgi:hypothetical protein